MKAFVYRKKDSKRIKIVKNVVCVYQSATRLIIDTENRSYTFSTDEVKTRVYQN